MSEQTRRKIEKLLSEWDAEVAEHGVWTSGHSIGVEMARILRSLVKR